MYFKSLLTVLMILSGLIATGQSFRVHGKITNTKVEPLAFVSIQVKELNKGTITKDDGSYELFLEDGKYDLVVSMIGYKPQMVSVVVRGENYLQNIIMEDEDESLAEVVLKAKIKDRSEEIIRNVIRNKDAIQEAAGAYSTQVYIRAVQEDSFTIKKKGKSVTVDIASTDADKAEMDKMAMAEILVGLDYQSSQRMKEERLAVTKRGDINNLFYLSTTEGDFNFYNNLVNIPSVSQVPFLSPISYSGLIAYRFKTIKTERIGTRRIYTISVKPRQFSNATVEGEITIADSTWTVLHTRFRLPEFHLPEYDFFEVEQHYSLIDNKAWMITRQQFTYYSKINKGRKSGQTIVAYKNFELNKQFDKNHFGVELSATAQSAYEKDTSFWENNRVEPLTAKEIRFIRYKDSLHRVKNTKQYLDSLDREINRITWKKLAITGQTFNDHERERLWLLPALPTLFQPFQFGGSRIALSFDYHKKYPSKKQISMYADLSYGLRNKDINGAFRFYKTYNPFNRAYYGIHLKRRFEQIFNGDAWINRLKRSNVFLNNSVGAHHRIELFNGFNLSTDVEVALRKSVSDYKTNPKLDSLFGDILDDNQAILFEAYNGVYATIRFDYTPFQKYLREPKEKIIIGSSWPTFYASLRKGVPKVLGSKVDFDYLEFGIEQSFKIGLAGTTTYNVRTGKFMNTRELNLVDYKFQRQGDPLLFMNPHEAFQALDSTFPVFKRFYQGHFVHEFNGALLNKIPLLKKLELREVAGAGFLIAPERDLRYGEVFAGIERIFKWPFNPLSKFKLGVYVVGSAANQMNNPVQFKVGLTTWDIIKNKWH